MAKRFIIIFILLCTTFIDINLLIAKTDEEIKYQIRLEKRQEYCSNNHIVFFYSQDFIQPFEDIDPKNINSVSELYCMATFYEDEGKLDAAMQSYKSILNLEPQFIDILIKVGDFYKNSYFNNYDMAIIYYNDAIKNIDNYLTNNISFLKAYTETYDKIIDIYKNLKLNNDAIKKYDDILTKLENMLKNPAYTNSIDLITTSKIKYLLGKAAISKKNDAIKIYENILFDIDPNNKEAIKQLAQTYYELGLLNETKALLEYTPVDNLLLGKVYFDLGEYDKAFDTFNTILKSNSNNAEAYYYRGQIYLIKGSCNKAKNDFQKAKSINPEIVKQKGFDWSNLKC